MRDRLPERSWDAACLIFSPTASKLVSSNLSESHPRQPCRCTPSGSIFNGVGISESRPFQERALETCTIIVTYLQPCTNCKEPPRSMHSGAISFHQTYDQPSCRVPGSAFSQTLRGCFISGVALYEIRPAGKKNSATSAPLRTRG